MIAFRNGRYEGIPSATVILDKHATHSIYRCYDDASRLLYIGCTCEPARRTVNHLATRGRVASILLQQFMDRYEFDGDEYRGRVAGQAAERAAIRAEQPVFNQQHTGVPSHIRDAKLARYIFARTGRWLPTRYDELGFDTGYVISASSLAEFFSSAAA